MLCSSCRQLLGTVRLTPEQISGHETGGTVAAFVDVWGQLEPLAQTTHVGRLVDGPTICIFSPDISRRHAVVSRDTEGIWTVTDLRSSNGTFVDGVAVHGDARLTNRCRVTFGCISFFFVEDVTHIGHRRGRRAIGATARAPSAGEAFRPTLDNMSEASSLRVELQQPTGGGGALITINGKSVQLTVAQHDLVSALVDRMLCERDEAAEHRGFVSIEELLGRLSLESTEAAAVNVRQLVRRVRRLFHNAGIGDVIESRHGRGYRLCGVPILAKRAQ